MKYAKYWVRMQGWTGYVYQDRFKSIRVRTEEQLLQSIRYIHLNRVRVLGGEEIDEYPFSGHVEIIGKIDRGIIDVDRVLELFGEKKYRLGAYVKFIEEGIQQNISKAKEIVYQELPDAEIQKKLIYKERLGEHLGTEKEKFGWIYEVERVRGKIRKRRKSDLLKIVAREEEVTMEELRSKGIKKAKVVEGKRLICFIGRTYLDFQLRELSDYLGIHEIALLRGTKKIEDLVRERDKSILLKINRILCELESSYTKKRK